eukprot:3900092-Rhodomonas_salina.1
MPARVRVPPPSPLPAGERSILASATPTLALCSAALAQPPPPSRTAHPSSTPSSGPDSSAGSTSQAGACPA